MNYFEAKNLCTVWPNIKINFSSSIEKGKMLCIVGSSGSGKSTTLRMIAGLLPLEKKCEQSLFLGGRNILFEEPGKRNIGMVFQTHALFSHLRVDDNVAYGLRVRGMSKKESRLQATEFLEKFNLAGFSERYPDSLSGGEAQRVCLARTLIVKPDLVLFDEPFSSLDLPLRKKLRSDINTLQNELQFTGILVTHDTEDVKEMADDVTIMKAGTQTWTGRRSEFSEAMLG